MTTNVNGKKLTLRDRLNDVPEIRLGRAYVCVGPNVWGKAFTPRQAWENAQRPTRFMMYDASPDTYIDEMGSSCYRPDIYAQPSDATAAYDAHLIGGKAVLLYTFGE